MRISVLTGSVPITDDRAEPLHGAGIHGQRLVAVEAGRELNAPRFRRGKLDVLFQLGDEGIGCAPEQRHHLPATGVRRAIGHLAVLAGSGPVVDGGAGDGGNVIARLQRHRTRSAEPFLHPPRAGIVGGGGEPEIAEPIAQLAEEFSRFRQRLHGIEGIEQPALAGGSRHELRDAFRALAVAGDGTDRIGLNRLSCTDHAGEEFQGQVFERAADPIIRHIASRVSVSRAFGTGFCVASSSTLGIATSFLAGAPSSASGRPGGDSSSKTATQIAARRPITVCTAITWFRKSR